MAGKLSQHELRELMREKVASKKAARIESPLAKYDSCNRLWCVVCNTIINSESLWPAHLITKSHKKKIEELKRAHKKPAEGKKRNHDESVDDVVPRKMSKFDKVSEFTKKEISIKESKAVPESTSKTENPPVVDAAIPQDFFDTNVIVQTKPDEQMEVDTANNTKTDLPQGFFDDPQQDARARKAVYKDPLEEQMELFRKEIAQETLVSEEIIEEEVEELQKEKTIDEIEEQMQNWSKVEQFQKKIEAIHEKRKKQTTSNDDNEEDESDSEDETNLNDVNFWRSKKVFQ